MNKCESLPRFTHTGKTHDRWYCLACSAVMMLPHGQEPPHPHDAGADIEAAIVPIPKLDDIIKKLPAPITTPVVKTALERHLSVLLPGDMSIIPGDKK